MCSIDYTREELKVLGGQLLDACGIDRKAPDRPFKVYTSQDDDAVFASLRKACEQMLATDMNGCGTDDLPPELREFMYVEGLLSPADDGSDEEVEVEEAIEADAEESATEYEAEGSEESEPVSLDDDFDAQVEKMVADAKVRDLPDAPKRKAKVKEASTPEPEASTPESEQAIAVTAVNAEQAVISLMQHVAAGDVVFLNAKTLAQLLMEVGTRTTSVAVATKEDASDPPEDEPPKRRRGRKLRK